MKIPQEITHNANSKYGQPFRKFNTMNTKQIPCRHIRSSDVYNWKIFSPVAMFECKYVCVCRHYVHLHCIF